jgi:hypothetical protein
MAYSESGRLTHPLRSYLAGRSRLVSSAGAGGSGSAPRRDPLCRHSSSRSDRPNRPRRPAVCVSARRPNAVTSDHCHLRITTQNTDANYCDVAAYYLLELLASSRLLLRVLRRLPRRTTTSGGGWIDAMMSCAEKRCATREQLIWDGAIRVIVDRAMPSRIGPRLRAETLTSGYKQRARLV